LIQNFIPQEKDLSEFISAKMLYKFISFLLAKCPGALKEDPALITNLIGASIGFVVALNKKQNPLRRKFMEKSIYLACFA